MPLLHSLIALACLVAAAEGAPPAGERFSVTGVRAPDTLNLRQSPDPGSEIVARIPPDAAGLIGTGGVQKVGKTVWREIVYGKQRGWANERFLGAQPGAATVFEEDLRCLGTEPNWDIDIRRDGQATCEAGCDGATGLRATPARLLGRKDAWSLEVRRPDGRLFVEVFLKRTGRCGDGMSDDPYKYQAKVRRADGTFSEGCCNRLRPERLRTQ
jgi:uncharacterized membrane protein